MLRELGLKGLGLMGLGLMGLGVRELGLMDVKLRKAPIILSKSFCLKCIRFGVTILHTFAKCM